jgi:hypothetical protein
MTLGKTLKQMMEVYAAAGAGSEKYTLEELKTIRRTTMVKIGEVEKCIASDIRTGSIPKYRLDYGDFRMWVKAACIGKAPNQDLWDVFIKDFELEDVEIVVKEEHDGGGTRDWTMIKAIPAKNLE